MARIIPVPHFRNHSVLEIFRGIRAFISLDAGLTRGAVPDSRRLEARVRSQTRELEEARRRLQSQAREIAQYRQRAEDGEPKVPVGGDEPGVCPENIVWVFGSPRTGSTWLGRIASELRGHSAWNEPFLGVVLGFRDNLANQGYTQSKNFVLGDPHREVWLGSIRRLFLEVCDSRFPDLRREDHLLVKEPNGSISAPLVMETFPESGLVLLIRDARDVVASLLDAAKADSWYGYERYEASLAEATSRSGRLALPRPESEDQAVEQLARNYAASINGARDAYENHGGPKTIVRYEDLCADTPGTVKRMYSELGITVGDEELGRAVDKHAWESLPDSDKGSGKFHRKGAPGGWREDLTPEQAAIVERVAAPILEEFYPE
jgi:hypothetical protein